MLEVGKNYEIKHGRNGSLAADGIHRISWQDGDAFAVEGKSTTFTISYYSFTRLPSFGDEVEVFESGKPYDFWENFWFVKENEDYFYVCISDKVKDFSKVGLFHEYKKSQYSFRLKSAEVEKVEPKLCAEQIIEKIKELLK